jgi:gamma-glutamyltranspeptidase / glutathione hydrolase
MNVPPIRRPCPAPRTVFGPRPRRAPRTLSGLGPVLVPRSFPPLAHLLLALLTLSVPAGCDRAPADEAPQAQDAPDLVVEPDIRPEVAGRNGAVVAGHPLAAQVGYEVLRAGGTAADAVVSMAAVLTVVRPHMNSVGGDAFALFYDAESGEVMALNASGRAAAGATPEFFRERGHESMPSAGALSVTVPGAVSGWAEALSRYGTLSFAEALAPAVEIAEEGFMVTRTLAEDLAEVSGRLNEAGQAIYRPGGEALPAGEVLRSPALAGTLRRLAEEGPGAMYGGSVGAALAAFLEEEGSPLRPSDFAAHEAEWAEPISVEFQGRRVHTVPPNSQGIVLLQMLGMADGLPWSERTPNSAQLLHELVEIKKIAFADRDRWVADRALVDVPVDELLAPDYLRERLTLVGDRAAEEVEPGFGVEVVDSEYGGAAGAATSTAEAGPGDDGDTVYIMAVDRHGNAVSWIQSIFSSMGSRLVEPTTGLVLQNRGAGFTLEEGHPNRIAPGKRPFHTLMAALVTGADGAFEMTIGTPGGHGQPQSVAQALVQTAVFGLSPQNAVEAPRFRSESGTTLLVERRLPGPVREELTALGHDARPIDGWTATFGSVKMIQRTPQGFLRTGADMRREGAALAF